MFAGTAATGAPAKSGVSAGGQILDPQTEALLRRMATGNTYFDSEIAKLTRGYGDLSKLVRMGLVKQTEGYGEYNQKTRKVEDQFTISSKGMAAVGGQKPLSKPAGIGSGTKPSIYDGSAVTVYGQAAQYDQAEDMVTMLLHSGRISNVRDVQVVASKKVAGASPSKGAWAIVPSGMMFEEQADPNPDEEDDEIQPQAGAPNGQNGSQQATPAPGVAKPPAPQPGPPTPPKPPQPPATPSQAAQNNQTMAPGTAPGMAPTGPSGPAAPMGQPNQADTMQAKQTADKIKQSGAIDPTAIDREIQNSVATSGKSASDQEAMKNLIKQQMGITN